MLLKIIGEMNERALAGLPWICSIDLAARFVGGPAASLLTEDAVDRWRSFAWESGIEPFYARVFHQTYVRHAPAHVGRVAKGLNEPLVAADFTPYETFLKTPFYRKWAEPQGLVDFVVGVLDKTPSSVSLFTVFRGARDGVADATTRSRMRVLTPHLRRALHIKKTVDAEKAGAATFAAVLEGLRAAVFLVDASGTILHANVSGRSILASEDFLHSTRGRLIARDTATDRILQAEVAAAAAGTTGPKSSGIALTSREDERYVAHVLPLAPRAGDQPAFVSRAVAAVFVHRRDIEALAAPEAIAEHYQLTPTELKVLLAVVSVGGGPDVAAALGIGSGTVKTHLRRLYDKTGASRQADLVKLVAGFGNPLLAATGDAEPVDAASWSGRVGCRSSADCYGANS